MNAAQACKRPAGRPAAAPACCSRRCGAAWCRAVQLSPSWQAHLLSCSPCELCLNASKRLQCLGCSSSKRGAEAKGDSIVGPVSVLALLPVPVHT